MLLQPVEGLLAGLGQLIEEGLVRDCQPEASTIYRRLSFESNALNLEVRNCKFESLRVKITREAEPTPLASENEPETHKDDAGKKKTVTVLFGTKIGTAEGFAKALAEEARARFDKMIFNVEEDEDILEECVHIAYKEITTLEKQNKLIEEEGDEDAEENEGLISIRIPCVDLVRM
eukprot:Gb_24993 [translate_table: standard]